MNGNSAKPPMGPRGAPAGAIGPGGGGNATNTLPARVNGVNGGMPNGPSGRHFKPFDHRRMNPMAEIQEDPGCAVVVENPYGVLGPVPPTVQKNTNMPHMPDQVRHTNYNGSGNGQQQQPQRKPGLMNPQVLDHRDSANFSMASSDSG